MNEKFIIPEADIISFANEDIILTSLTVGNDSGNLEDDNHDIWSF